MKVFLGFSALAWLGGGLSYFVVPGFLSEAAGVSAATPTGTTEIRAMYGGLQAAIGVLAGGALVRPDLIRPALTTLLFLTAGLGTARVSGLWLDRGLSAYTAATICFEMASAGVAFVLLRRLA